MKDCLKEFLSTPDVVREKYGPQGDRLGGESFLIIEQMFEQKHGPPPANDPQQLQLHQEEFLKCNDNLMVIMIALRSALPSNIQYFEVGTTKSMQFRHQSMSY